MQNQNHRFTCDYSIYFLENLRIWLIRKVLKATQDWEKLGAAGVQAQKVL